MISVAAVILIVSSYIAFQVRGNQCESPAVLKTHAGHYARKSLWDKLSEIKDWGKVNAMFGGWISAVDVSSKGETSAILGWHEGEGACIKFKDGYLWAKEIELPPNPPKNWDGPFINIGMNKSIEIAYFNKIFGNGCFISDREERWCFGPGAIQVDGKRYKASLFVDMSEMPNYGVPISVDDENGFWIFVSTDRGWNVFKDTFVSEEGHTDVNPSKTPPWRTLRTTSIRN